MIWYLHTLWNDCHHKSYNYLSPYLLKHYWPCSLCCILHPVAYLFYNWRFVTLNPFCIFYLPSALPFSLSTTSLFSVSMSLFSFCFVFPRISEIMSLNILFNKKNKSSSIPCYKTGLNWISSDNVWSLSKRKNWTLSWQEKHSLHFITNPILDLSLLSLNFFATNHHQKLALFKPHLLSVRNTQ